MSVTGLIALAALESPSRLADPLAIAGLVLAFLGLLLAIFSKDIAEGISKIRSKKAGVPDVTEVKEDGAGEPGAEGTVSENERSDDAVRKKPFGFGSPLVYKITALLLMLAGVIMVVVGV